MENPEQRRRLTGAEKIALTVFSIVVLGVSAGISVYMLNNKPRPDRGKPPEMELTVQVRELNPTDHQIFIPVMGTVIPATQIDLRPRVAGQIVWTNPEFVEGGIILRHDIILKIDPTDYELALVREKSALETAVYEYKVEQGRQEIAKVEWELLGLKDEASELDQELALRQPHIREKEVKLEAARARVEQAQLDLERTVLKAPFNAVVRTVDVDVGGQASAQTTLATLVGTDTFRIQAAVPVDQLRWIHIPNSPGVRGSDVLIHTGTGVVRRGRVQKLLSDLEPSGKLARVLIDVDDPLDLNSSPGERRPLLLGEFVRLEIKGRTIEDVYAIPRLSLRDGNRIWSVDEESRLRILDVDIIWQGAENVLVRELPPGLSLVISDIPAPVEGMRVRVSESEERQQ